MLEDGGNGAAKRKIIPRRVSMSRREPALRIKDFEEVSPGYTAEEAVAEANRCIQCKEPHCRDGCPVGLDIPTFIGLIAEGRFEAAAAKIREENLLPAVCGRVCPQEAQCEQQCTMGKKYDPVAIGRLERFVGDFELARGKEAPPMAPPSGRRAAVVGSGPGALACAADLARRGHAVTIFESLHKPGGVLTFGIPEFRLPKRVVEAEIEVLRRMDVTIECNVVVGRTVTVDELLEEGFSAVYIGTGAGSPRFPNIPGQNLPGVQSASGFLTRVNLMKAYRFPEYDTPVRVGSRVVVLGGGNVAMDAARTALRLGAEEVRVLYRRSREELPARREEIHHAEEEGVELMLLTAPVCCIGGEDGRINRIECVCCELGDLDESGRRRPIPIPGAGLTVETDNVIVAIGQSPNPLIQRMTAGLETLGRGMIKVDPETGATTKRGVFAGGDVVTGAATVILAMGAGRVAARAIDDYLRGGNDFWE
ncbi:MAG: NADPH-dependent glutamate synthase [Candidatus Desulforudis sp.]|nr:NADPH-dependent glutamate synthase [Desulforudis sp.]